jgi:hypothetical protein
MAPIDKSKDWKPLAIGGFNEVYVNAKAGLVFKTAQNSEDDTDTPERSVRLWNLLNPDLKPKAKLATILVDGYQVYGWTCPYIRNQYSKTQVSTDAESMIQADKIAYITAMQDPETKKKEDEAIVTALIDIYNRTGRVILDAPVLGNFITVAPGKAICVDMGLALLLEKKEEDCLNTYARRSSITSNSAWETLHSDISTRILNAKDPMFPATAQMTKALLFIRTFRPDITNVDFLKKDKQCVGQLAAAYNAASGNDHNTGIELLDQKRPVNLISMKDACTHKLLDYIHTRGILDEGKKFKASWFTKIFRNKLLTTLKVDSAQLLIKNINAAQSVEDIQAAISQASKHPLLQRGLSSDFKSALGLCKVMSQIPPSDFPKLAYGNPIS